MTDRHAAYIVVLDRDIREDDAEQIRAALLMIKSVIDVRPVVSDIEFHIAEQRVRHELAAELHLAVDGVLNEVRQR